MLIPLADNNVAKRAIRVLREEGIKSFWFKLLSEMNCYRRAILFERSLEVPILEVRPHLSVAIGLLKKNEVDEYVKFRAGASPSRTADRLGAGRLCFVARYEGKIISACWATIHKIWSPYLVCEIRPALNEVYIYDGFTKPDFRNQSIFPAILAEMMRYFRGAGCRRMIVGVVPENKPSLAAMRKVGFRHFETMGYIKIGPWRWAFYDKRYGSIMVD